MTPAMTSRRQWRISASPSRSIEALFSIPFVAVAVMICAVVVQGQPLVPVSTYEKPAFLLGPEVSLGTRESSYYYAIEDLARAEVVRRGFSTISGIVSESVILRPETRYRIWLLHETGLQGHVDITTPTAGQRFTAPPVSLGLGLGMDSDGDGLDDDAEYILGTNPTLRDTDGDGIADGVEHAQGTNPLDGRPVVTGIIASTDTPGDVVDVTAFNDIAVVADSSAGVVVFNVQGQNPIRIAQVDTPGNAVGVSLAGNVVAVADGPGGLAIIDVTDPTAANRRQVGTPLLGGSVQAVTAFGSLAIAGTDNGWISLVDLPTASVLDRRLIASRIEDVVVEGDVLYAYTSDGLETFSFAAGIEQLGSVPSPSPSGINGAHGRGRMFVGGGLAYLVHTRGVNVFNVSDPEVPVLLLQGNEVPAQFGWKQVALNGSGLLLAAASPNQAFDGPHNVRVYDAASPAVFPTLLTEYVTPGVARAVSIYNGLAYVADSSSGLHVVNYRAFDTGRTPPAITLSASFTLSSPTNGVAEEGKAVRVSASVTDDVQVRNVEFYVDGVRQAIDGNFPFEHHFLTPARSATKTKFTVQAKASDTGGNFTWSLPIEVILVADATPPFVVRAMPGPDTIVGQVSVLTASFSEPIVESTLTSNTFRLRLGGADGLLDTGDDQAVTNGVISYRSDGNVAFLDFSTNLPPGLYRASIHPAVADLAGNAINRVFTWRFWVLGGADTDQDGIPDAIELAMGLDPNSPSSLNDGVLDGNRDSDGDGLRNSWELIYGFDPRLRDTNNDGIPDGAEDSDHDGLTNLQEQANNVTHPLVADTDGDGWNDEVELTVGSNPVDRLSTPRLMVVATPTVRVISGGLGSPAGLPANVTVAEPPLRVIAGGLGNQGGVLANTTVARPPVRVITAGLGNSGGLTASITVAQPPVRVITGGLGNAAGLSANVAVARPPVRVIPGGLGNSGGLPPNTSVAEPPISVRFE
jgi:hypothetical protein